MSDPFASTSATGVYKRQPIPPLSFSKAMSTFFGARVPLHLKTVVLFLSFSLLSSRHHGGVLSVVSCTFPFSTATISLLWQSTGMIFAKACCMPGLSGH